jgi:hypothetical protein
MIFAIFVFGLLMIPADAQNQGEKSSDGVSGEEASVKFFNESFKVIGTKTGFETKVVRGAPYTATVETENIQTFTDGNSIKNKSTSLVYRDNEGRTRRENEIQTKGKKIVKEIFITDPVTGINYTLDENTKKAFRIRVNLQDFDLSKKKPEKLVNIDNNAKPIKPREVLPKNKSADQFEKPSNRDTSVTESLGKKLIEGINCEGKRTALTIPAGEIGNTLPIKIVSEQWYSPELQVLVLTIHRDPRRGETIYRLTNIKRFEPDRSLFEVPANYTVIDKSEIKKKARE